MTSFPFLLVISAFYLLIGKIKISQVLLNAMRNPSFIALAYKLGFRR